MIDVTKLGAVAVIALGAPPVNALGLEMRRALLGALQRSFDDDGVAAVVIRSSLPIFCGGADIQEFKTDALWQAPNLPEICDALDRAPKPVIAAINGTAMGGAVELALACDYRIARQGATLGLPEVKLGLLPGAGGVQRLTRIAGPATAADMILSGKPIGAAQAHSVGLLDRVVADAEDFEGETLRYAEELLASKAPTRPTRAIEVDCTGLEDGFFENRKKALAAKTRGQVAPLRCLQSIEEACRLPLDEGLGRDRDGFQALLDTPQARGLIYLFFAEREAQKIPGVPRDTPTREVARVAVIGAGTMGTGIAVAFLDAGIPVTLMDLSDESLARGLDAVARHDVRALAKGRLDEAALRARQALLTGSLDYRDLAAVDLVIEAVFETMDVKKRVFGELDRHCKDGAILASNTSTLDLDEIAGATGRPGDVIGLHFFSPANIMRLLEVVRGAKTSVEVVQTAMALAKTIRKVPVVVGVCHGFVGNRMLRPYNREGARLLLEGARPEQVDRVLTDFGMAMGIISVADLAGIDVGYRIRAARREETAHDPGYFAIQDKLFALGRYGQKSGRGSYIYAGREKKNDPEMAALCETLARELGVERRSIPDREILERCLYPLINEGIQTLDDGIATRAGDCDIIWVNGYGFPAWRGGPLHYAEEIGLGRVLAGMEKYRKDLGAYGEMWFRPAPLLERLVATGARSISLC